MATSALHTVASSKSKCELFCRQYLRLIFQGDRDWVHNKQPNKHKDQFYVTIFGLRGLEDADGFTRDEVRTCMESMWTDRINELGDENADYTKCILYKKCGLEVDWEEGSQPQCGTSTTTTTSTSTTSTTTTESTTTSQPDGLPDYNNDDYTFSCNQNNRCNLVMSDGQTFIGTTDGEVVTFTSVPFAQPPIGDLRWKAPELITKYDETVDARVAGWQCANLMTVDDPTVRGESEDCLHIKIQVQEQVLKQKQKVPTVAYIHGGGFNWGVNSDDWTMLASQGLAVFDINYRLGPYGFFALESAEEGQEFSSNWGILDQLAGLKWISMYAGVFGGDKDQVTLDGCSAGSASAFFHLTSPQSWPYFHRIVTGGMGLAAGSYFQGEKTDLIRNSVFQEAGVSTIDQLRQFSTQQLRTPFNKVYNALGNVVKQSPTLDNVFAPVVDGVMIEDLLVYAVRDGKIRPNTPISFNYAKDDAWNFSEEAFDYLKEDLLAADQDQIDADIASTGFIMPSPWPHTMLETMYPEDANQLKQVFPCEADSECKDGFARWVVASHWYCNTRWAMNGALKTRPGDFGPVYPMQWGYDNCGKVDDVSTKTCHCGESDWIRGGRVGIGGSDLGSDTKAAWGHFYRTGTFVETNGNQLKSWEEMNFNQFNMIGRELLGAEYETYWNQSAILNWEECDLLDQIHERTGSGYSFGVTKDNP